jgi:hypothetical protein
MKFFALTIGVGSGLAQTTRSKSHRRLDKFTSGSRDRYLPSKAPNNWAMTSRNWPLRTAKTARMRPIPAVVKSLHTDPNRFQEPPGFRAIFSQIPPLGSRSRPVIANRADTRDHLRLGTQ